MAALKRELLLSDASTDPSVRALRAAVVGVEASLADGDHIERDRADVVCEVLGVTGVAPAEMARLGRQINSAVKRALHRAGSSSIAGLDRSTAESLVSNVTGVATIRADPGSAVIRPAHVDVLAALDVREAWIYRDWQDAIGEAMLDSAAGAARRFDVKGYRGFVRMTQSPEPFDEPWFGRLQDLTSDLDVTADARLDARIAQLRGVLNAVAKLILEFHTVEPARSSVSNATLDAVKTTVASSKEPLTD